MHRWFRSRSAEAPLDDADWAPIAALLAAYMEPKRTVDPFTAAGPALAREAVRRRTAAAPRRLPWFRLMPLTAAIALLLVGVGTLPATDPEVRVMAPAGIEVGTPSFVVPTANDAPPLGADLACPTPTPPATTQPADVSPSPTCAPESEIGPR